MRLPATLTRRQIFWGKAVAWLLCLAPLARLVLLGLNGGLGANPIEFITRSTGTWALAGLLATLSFTPLRRLTGLAWLIRFRRLFGLFSFFYACLHFTTYIWLDQFFDLVSIASDIAKRPFITIGLSAFIMLIPLAATSNQRMMKKLGRNWRRLHSLTYLTASLGVAHYWWLVKKDITQPLVYACVLAILLAMRLPACKPRKHRA